MTVTGMELVNALDRAGWPAVASLWLFHVEINQWRLVVASPTVDETGPLAAYGIVGDVLDRLHRTLPLNGLSVVTPKHPIVQALASSAYAQGGNVNGRRVHGAGVNGRFVDDAYLYRLTSNAPAV